MISRRRTLPAAAVAGALALAACGGGSAGSEGAASGDSLPAPAATADVSGNIDDEPVVATDVPPPPATEVVSEPVTADEPAPEPEAPAEPADEPAPAVEPDPVTPPAEIGGRALAADVQAVADFAGNPFPDLVVNDVGRNGEVNIRNILPSDRPVLLWTWAPH